MEVELKPRRWFVVDVAVICPSSRNMVRRREFAHVAPARCGGEAKGIEAFKLQK